DVRAAIGAGHDVPALGTFASDLGVVDDDVAPEKRVRDLTVQLFGPVQILGDGAGPGVGIVVAADVEVVEPAQLVTIVDANHADPGSIGRAVVGHAPGKFGDERDVG